MAGRVLDAIRAAERLAGTPPEQARFFRLHLFWKITQSTICRIVKPPFNPAAFCFHIIKKHEQAGHVIVSDINPAMLGVGRLRQPARQKKQKIQKNKQTRNKQAGHVIVSDINPAMLGVGRRNRPDRRAPRRPPRLSKEEEERKGFQFFGVTVFLSLFFSNRPATKKRKQKLLARRPRRGLRWVVADAEALPLEAGCVDAYTAS